MICDAPKRLKIISLEKSEGHVQWILFPYLRYG